MTENNTQKLNRLFWILRIASAGCFIGHGAFGIMTKVEWLPYFFTQNISPNQAFSLMPVIGAFDILMGTLLLLRPCPIILVWMASWGVMTAFLRPLAGQGEWEFFERAGNYGVPLTYLILSGWFENRTGLFQLIEAKTPRENLFVFARLALVWTTGLLLIGHGAFLALMKKDLFTYQFLMLGVHIPAEYMVLAGVAELGMGFFVFWRQPAWLLTVILVWKVLTELLYPLAGFPVWEFVERFGSYGAPLALLYMTRVWKTVR